MHRAVRLLFSTVLVGAGTIVSSPATAATGYTITDLGTLGGDWTRARGINEAGDIVGTSALSTAGSRAFRWKGGLMTNIGSIGGLSSEGLGISDDGWVVGSAQRSDSWPEAFWWAGTDPHPIGTLGGLWSEAYAINDAHQIVGRSLDPTGQVEAFLWEGGTMQPLGSLGPNTFSDAYGINNAGVVVGESGTADGPVHAFSYFDGVMADLGTPSPNFAGSFARDINDAGTIVGGVWVEGSPYTVHPFIRTADGSWDVVTEVIGYAEAVNENGAIVGSHFDNHPERAFLYQGGVFTDLTSVIPAGEGWELSVAYDINDHGQIVGEGFHNDAPRGFRLDGTRIAADLGVSLAASPDPVLAGTPVTFVATVTNGGPFDATSVQLNVSLPVNHTSIGCSADGGGACSGTGSSRTVTFATMASGAEAHATFTVGSPASAADGAPYGATASVDAAEPDPGPVNDTDSASVTISNSADLAVSATQTTDKAKTGQIVRQTFVVRNLGPGSAGAVVLNEILPEGLDVVASSPSSACQSTAEGVQCDFGSVAAGASRTVTVDVRVTAGGARLVSTATVSSATHDPVSANNSASLEVRTTGPRK